MSARADLLLGVRHSERLIQDRIEVDFAAPPIVVVLLVFGAHEEPPVVDFPASSNDGDSGTLGDALFPLGFVRQAVPLMNWKF